MKQKILFLGLCVSAGIFAQNAILPAFKSKIEPREVKTPEELQRDSRISPSEKAIRELAAERKNATYSEAEESGRFFIDWLERTEDIVALNGADTSDTPKEKMDSILRISLSGNPVSRQVFTYTPSGKPLTCTNYIPDETSGRWKNIGYYNFEYDEYERMIARELIDETNPSQNQRYEYVYTDESPYYAQQLYYTHSDDGWMPSQRGEYVYDSRHNTIEEKYANFDPDRQEWAYDNRKTAAFDDQDRITKYHCYLWDKSAQAWTGDTRPTVQSLEFEYTPSGKDAITYSLYWENNEWLRYHRNVYTYDDKENIIKWELQYWNRARQDWSGNDKNPFNQTIQYNTYVDYILDSKDRIEKETTYRANNTGQFRTVDLIERTFTDREDGSYDAMTTRYLAANTAEPTLYQKVEQSINKHGSEYYYKNYAQIPNMGTGLFPTGEEIRYIDENNNYNGGDFYDYYTNENNERYRASTLKERFYYADDWESRKGHWTPIRGVHWKGSHESDTIWNLHTEDRFKWEVGPNGKDVLIEAIGYQYVKENMVPYQGYSQSIDYSTPRTDVFTFPITSQSDNFRSYKVIKESKYFNYLYFMGQTEWNQDLSYADTYFYSPLTGAGVETVDDNIAEAEIIGYYNVNGQFMPHPEKGINIVRYSNGKYQKIMVK